MKAFPTEFVCLMSALAAFVPSAMAQDKAFTAPVKMVVGFAPGGSADSVGRIFAQKLSTQMNANIIVENKDGANSNIAAEYVARAKPDGYTLLLNAPNVVLSPALGEKVGYNILKDLAPIALATSSPQVLYVHPSVPANNLSEFITYVRSNSEKVVYGSSGIGSIPHMAAALFLLNNNLNVLHVPYKSGNAASIDLLAGRVQFRFAGIVAELPKLQEKRLKVLAITSLKRSPLLPDVPTMNESGMPGFEVESWYGFMAPANTPAAIVNRLNGEIMKALQDPEFKAKLAQNDVEARGSTPQEYGTHIRSELERWTKVVKSAGIKAE